MVRCWARRRWEPLLRDHVVLETEHEGSWKLADVLPDMTPDEREAWERLRSGEFAGDTYGEIEVLLQYRVSARRLAELAVIEPAELHFLSRPDALLLERSTGYLYLQSFKTTGSWDRRKELDAQVDMQGLSEAVDVERRFGEAWHLLNEIQTNEQQFSLAEIANDPEYLDASQRVRELVSPRVADWLRSLPDPPTILGVRYEYLLKGPRREDKKAQPGEPRWNQESVLVRAYCQEGITSDDRRWAWTYDWKDEGGKGRRLDYRSWRKVPVWRSMAIRDWVDLLDQGKVQEGALGEDGEPLDALGAQLVPVVVSYRAADEMRDLLEQLAHAETQVAQDVEKVRQAEREGGASAKRSTLNQYFPQNRQACSYPGLCAYRTTATQPGFCFGGPDPSNDPSVQEHFQPRQANHPQELSGLVQIVEN
jgi:hypothetical protein